MPHPSRKHKSKYWPKSNANDNQNSHNDLSELLEYSCSLCDNCRCMDCQVSPSQGWQVDPWNPPRPNIYNLCFVAVAITWLLSSIIRFRLCFPLLLFPQFSKNIIFFGICRLAISTVTIRMTATPSIRFTWMPTKRMTTSRGAWNWKQP